MNSLIETTIKHNTTSNEETIDNEFKEEIKTLLETLKDYKDLLKLSDNLVLKHGVDNLLESLYYLIDPNICVNNSDSWEKVCKKINEIEQYLDSPEFENFMIEVNNHVNLVLGKTKLKIKFKNNI